jgi:hypothetical protein
MALRDRLPMLLELRKDHLRTLQANASDPTKDSSGIATASVQGTLRFIGVAEFALTGSVASFRRHLGEVAKLGLRLLERFDEGESIDPPYVAMLRYKDVFNALAAVEMTTAGQIGQRLGGRQAVEEKYNHPFDRCLGYALKSLVCGSPDQMANCLAEFDSICSSRENANFAGYAIAFRGVLNRDASIVQEGLKEIVKGHKNLVKRGGVFHDMEDEVVAVWGVGVANLARSQGMRVSGVSPLIPNELLCD